MRIPFRTPAPALALAALLSAAPAAGQVGNQTDIPPVPPPGGVSGSYLGPGARFENELLVRAGDRVLFRDGRAACAARRSAAAWRDSVARAPRTPAQARVDSLLVRGSGGPAAVEALAAVLRDGTSPESPTGQAARAAAEALDGLFRPLGECRSRREQYPEAPQWDRAIRGYAHFLETAPDAVFSPPAPELQAVHDALSAVLAQTFRAIRRRGA